VVHRRENIRSSDTLLEVKETKRQEHVRLQKRTDALKREHEGLSLDRQPFNQTAHNGHTAHLRRHLDDLKKHRARSADKKLPR
jgi:hypothetical protein